MTVYESITDGKVHMALSRGELSGDGPVLTRVQAATHVVDVFGFQTSDSWLQIEMALKRIAEEGRGVFLYMNIAGQASDEVIRTLKTHLGQKTNPEGLTNAVGDGALREMGTGAQILLDLGVGKMKLMTNNPRKIVGLEGFGLEWLSECLYKCQCQKITSRFTGATSGVGSLVVRRSHKRSQFLSACFKSVLKVHRNHYKIKSKSWRRDVYTNV